ncbi:MAG: hypothetical protein HYW22_00105 [Candidatus Aenigmarchaeota archaeon]|nr:hypothetical protein [Candidatus Aenigmarchaeota archaeon]
MFMSGLFPGHVKRKTVPEIYLSEGASSYSYVAEHSDRWGLFESLSRNLGRCVNALNYMVEHYIQLERASDGDYVLLAKLDADTKMEMLQDAVSEWNEDPLDQDAMRRALYWAGELGFDITKLLEVKRKANGSQN